jgi:hypothetical protein
MESNIQNPLNVEQSRLESVRQSLARAIDDHASASRRAPGTDRAFLFAYAFGLRVDSVCDLFTLLRIAPDLITQEEIDELTRRYTAEIQARYAGGGLSGLESLARSYGFGGFVESAKTQVKASAEEEIRKRVTSEVQRRMTDGLRRAGDTTLRMSDLATLWKSSGDRFKDAEQLIYGDTPMCEALRQIEQRFTRELKGLSSEGAVLPMLLLISDGEPSDGDPEPLAQRIEALGVTVVSCYLTSSNITSPRRLMASEQPEWPAGARRLFRMASRLPSDSPLIPYLVRVGWSVEPNAKCFIQANHSEHVDDVVGLVMTSLSPAEESLPKGW